MTDRIPVRIETIGSMVALDVGEAVVLLTIDEAVAVRGRLGDALTAARHDEAWRDLAAIHRRDRRR